MLSTLCCLAALAFQEPGPPEPAPASGPPAAPDQAPAVVDWNDKDAKAKVKAFEKVFKDRSSGLREKLAAIESLASGRNDKLIRPLAKVVQTDRSVEVRKRAAALLGNQPPAKASRAILQLIASPKVTIDPNVLAAVIDALSSAGYQSPMWRDLDRLFEQEYHLERVPIQKALLRLVSTHRETEAWPILLRNLDEPAPADPDSPTNPPASYWEARWKSWQIWRGDVKEAMFAITGQRFSTASEAREWAKKNGKKVGL